jgi:dienelactone hydrolase
VARLISKGADRRRRQRVGAALVAGVALAGLAAGCDGGSADPSAGRDTPPTASTTPAPPPTTNAPDITPVPRPDNVDDEAFAWFVHPAPSGGALLFGVLRSSAPMPHPVVLLVHASAGLTVDSVAFGEELAALGFDVVIGCWFASDPTPDLAPQVIPCGDAPPFRGVVDAAVPDLASLVEASRDALGSDREVAILGTSRGAALAALRATGGAREPIVLLSGPYEGWNLLDDPPRAEVNVVERAGGVVAPVLIAHGVEDLAVPVSQAEHFEAVLRGQGADVDAVYYPTGHNLLGAPAVGDDLVDRIRTFLCARLTCSPAA